MKFKIVSLILSAFTLIGLGLLILTEFDSLVSAMVSSLLYVIMPAYGAYGLWYKRRLAIGVSLMLFVWQSVRRVNPDSVIPHISPITVSVAVGDFSNGDGYVIDFFAIGMVALLAWLLGIKSLINKKAD